MIKFLKPLAILAILGFPIAVICFRTGVLSFPGSFQILSYTVFLAVAVFLVGMVISFVKRQEPELAKSARTAAMLALLPIIGLGTQMFTSQSVPYIHNISTDVANPPTFEKVADLRTEDHNPLDYDVAKLADIQTKAYPNVKTLYTDLSVADAHAKALSLIESMGWELVNNNVDRGIIEATETTMIWGFKDDVVVRISTQGNNTAVDLRSVSRMGGSDLGANAKRIEKFLAKFSR